MITFGSIASEAVAVIDSLASQGISCTLMVASSIIPPPLPILAKTLPHFRQVMTVEAHYINGGIGSLVSEFAAEVNYDCPLPVVGLKPCLTGRPALKSIYTTALVFRERLLFGLQLACLNKKGNQTCTD